MARFSMGDLVYHNYGERPLIYHERLVIEHVEQNDYIIATPDRDVYLETLDNSNPDLESFHVGGAGGALPHELRRRNVYGFGVLSARDYRALQDAGHREAVAERARRGLAAPAAAMAAPAQAQGANPGAPAAAAAVDDKIWVFAEMVAGHLIGEEVTVVAGMASDGDWGLHRMNDADGKARTVLVSCMKRDDVPSFCEEKIQLCRDAEATLGDDLVAADDARTLSIQYGVNGDRSRSFKASVQEMKIEEFSDFPFNPRTCGEYLKAITDVAESCLAQHTMWVTQSGVPSGDRSIYEDDCLARVMDMAIKFDGLNVANLASFELIARRRQLIAEAHAHSPAAPSYEGADHFMQTGFRPGSAIVVPSLTKYVSEKLHQEGQIMKERRKMREERNSRGRGRGQPGKNNPGQESK